MLQNLSGEIVTQSLDLAGRLLREAADTTLQAQLENHLLEALDSVPENQREQMRRDWRTEDTAWLETAAQPGGETSRRFTEAVARLAGRELALNARNNPALIGGARLRIGGRLWDASVAGQLVVAPTAQQEVSSPSSSSGSSRSSSPSRSSSHG
jgi:F0F1-type ATP synthase delta subunit